MNKPKKAGQAPRSEPPAFRRSPLPWILSVTLLAAVGVLLLLQRRAPSPPPAAAVATEDSSPNSTRRLSRPAAAALPPDQAGSTGAPSSRMGSTESAQLPPSPPAEPEPEQNAQISHIIDDFRGYSKTLDGYKLEGVERTNDGIALAKSGDTQSSESDSFRRGTIESPVLPFTFPSNAVQPIWRAKLPGSETSLRVEVALSPDARNWSEWYQIGPTGDDISPTYPDGRPNPNYGAVSGNMVSNGLKLFPYMRYRVTLASTGADVTPVLEEFKITYLDSTEGQGYPADKAQEKPEETPAP